ncbi:MAG: hypothetical protein JW847_02950 [Candidatus Omnitrophica bacterium]|nr:hypothetical protein [Candidatus Omnitrophota bacterium]
MKILKFFLKLFLVLAVFFFIAASIYVRIYGKSIVERALVTALNRNVVLGNASYHFPFGLRAKNVYISKSLKGGEFLRIQKVIAQLSLDTIYRGKLAFDKVALIGPSLVIEGKKAAEAAAEGPLPAPGQTAEGAPIPPDMAQKEDAATGGEDQNKTVPVQVLVHRLIVKQGKLHYAEGLTDKGFTFGLEDVQLQAGNLVFPAQEGRSEFMMSALLIKEGNMISGSRVRSLGWVDVFHKDMEAQVEVVEANGTVGLTAKAVSKNNDMDVTGEIKMRNLLSGLDQQVSSDASSVNDLVLNALSSAKVEIGAKFAFKTKMDDFRIGQVSFSGNVVTK